MTPYQHFLETGHQTVQVQDLQPYLLEQIRQGKMIRDTDPFPTSLPLWCCETCQMPLD
jgi:hypothetical protein